MYTIKKFVILDTAEFIFYNLTLSTVILSLNFVFNLFYRSACLHIDIVVIVATCKVQIFDVCFFG